MRAILTLFLLALPILELVALIAMGAEIGLLATLGWILLTGILGAWVLRVRGPRAMARTMREAASQDSPVSGASALDMLAMALAGFLLVVPGPITDALGLLLLIGPLRRWLLKAWLGKVLQQASVRGYSRYSGGVIIEGERVDDDNEPRDPAAPSRRIR